MRPEHLEDAEEWLLRAELDMQMARLALEANPILGSGVAFHAQQAAEKTLKGYLTAYGRSVAKTHLLLPLIAECSTIEPTFQRFTLAGRTLTPYATEFRYPGSRIEPPEAEARAAYQHATDILQFVRDALANATSPQAN